MSENSNQPVMGRVYSLESFGSVDGPGVRFVIFLQGCAMRCKFCHNADSWDMQKGDLYSSDELLKKALRFRSYWAEKGGITISGGEPPADGLSAGFLQEGKGRGSGYHH